jgi:hypothetical protein
MTRERSERWWKIHEIMEHMPLSHALRWCDSGPCGCMGCANRSGGLSKAGITEQEWRDYMAEQVEQFVPKDGVKP